MDRPNNVVSILSLPSSRSQPLILGARLCRHSFALKVVVPRRSPYVATRNLPETASEYQVHDPERIAKMRPSTTEIDKAVHQMLVDVGYGGFPKSVCTSINECMCHGIPNSRQFQCCRVIMVTLQRQSFCGNVTDEVERLVKVTEECMERGTAVCKDGVSFKKIGKRISEHAERYGFRVVERFVGHGVGTIFHSQPIINHHRNEEPGVMVENQTFTIVSFLSYLKEFSNSPIIEDVKCDLVFPTEEILRLIGDHLR